MSRILINILPSIFISFFFQFLFHEAGHLLGGLATGWHFIYLQIYNLTAFKIRKSVRIILIRSSDFQCIMYPDSLNSDAIIYTVSGCIMNLICAITGFIVMLACYSKPIIWLHAWCFFVSGLAFFLVNSIPSTARVCNDMACYRLLKSDCLSRLCHNSQLVAAKHLYDGKTYGQIGEEIICLTPGTAYNDILAYQAVLEYYYYLEKNDCELMEKSLNKIQDESQVSKGVMNIVYMERLYLNIFLRIKNKDFTPIALLSYQDDIRNYIKKHEKTGYVHSMRVKAAYEAYELMGSGNKDKAADSIDYAVKYIEGTSCLYAGEVKFCIKELLKLRKMLG